jgi:transcription antitermination factor NusG
MELPWCRRWSIGPHQKPPAGGRAILDQARHAFERRARTLLSQLQEFGGDPGRAEEADAAATPLLFPGYCFVFIELQWHAARWSPGRLGLIMAGDAPVRVSDAVIAELRGRERDGLIELPKAPGLKPGDHVRIIAGPFSERLALYEGRTSHERGAVLLQFLGGRHRTELPANGIEPKEGVS